jgi:hypothetical protein
VVTISTGGGDDCAGAPLSVRPPLAGQIGAEAAASAAGEVITCGSTGASASAGGRLAGFDGISGVAAGLDAADTEEQTVRNQLPTTKPGQDMHTRFVGDAVAIAVDLAEELPGFEEVAGFVPDFPPTAEFDDLSAGFGEAMSGFAGCFASALCVRRKRNTSIQQVLPTTKDNEAGPHFIPLVRRELNLKVH